MSHFKEVCRYCRGVIRECRCYAGGVKPVTYKTCEACLAKGFEPEVCNGAVNPTPADPPGAQAYLDWRKGFYDLFDIPLSTPLDKAMSLIRDFRKRYNEKDAGYIHLMAACEVALGKDGPFVAESAAARIEQLVEEHKTLTNTREVYEHAVRRLREDLARALERCAKLKEDLAREVVYARGLEEENKSLQAPTPAAPRTWRAGTKVRPDEIQRGMVFRTLERRLAVIGFYIDGETKTVLVEDADKRNDILERWGPGALAQCPLAEDFTDGAYDAAARAAPLADVVAELPPEVPND